MGQLTCREVDLELLDGHPRCRDGRKTKRGTATHDVISSNSPAASGVVIGMCEMIVEVAKCNVHGEAPTGT
jgi:hypothetical protein